MLGKDTAATQRTENNPRTIVNHMDGFMATLSYNVPLRRRSITSPARARTPTSRSPKTATWLVLHTELVSSCSADRTIGSMGCPAPSPASVAEVSTTNSYAPLIGWASAEVTPTLLA